MLSTFIGAMIALPLDGVLPHEMAEAGHWVELFFEVLAAIVALVGVAIAALLYLGSRKTIDTLLASERGQRTWQLFHGGLGFDGLYDRVFVRPFLATAKAHEKRDWIETVVNIVPALSRGANTGLAAAQSGRLRAYAMIMFAGAAVILALLMFG